jgi:hypothetical protein
MPRKGMNIGAICACAAVLLAARPACVAGQELSSLPEGTRLRVNGRCDGCVQAKGDFVAFTRDTLWLAVGRGRRAFSSGEIISLDVLLSSSRGRGTSNGFLVGGLAGAGFGLVVGAIAESGGQDVGAPVALISTIFFGGIGAILGGLAGLGSGGEEWEPLPLPAVPPSSVPPG